MAGRPKNPSWTIPVWAPNANYPVSADPWSATPTKTTHPGAASVGITPKTGVAAQVLNKCMSDAYATDGSAQAYDSSVIDYLGQIPALNLLPSVNATAVNMVRYNPVIRKWCGLGSVSTDYFTTTSDLLTWPAVTDVTAGAKTVQTHWDFDIATNGDIVVVDNTIDGTKSRIAAGTWTKHVGAIGFDPVEPNIVYEPVSGKWCLAYQSSGSGILRVATSTNLGTSWTASTPPTFATSAYITLGKNGTGRIVMQGMVGTNIYLSHSDDGGVTWSAAQTIAVGFTTSVSGYKPRPIWTGTHWIALAANIATPNCKVYQSATGAAGTWSLVATFATTCIRFINSVGALVLGITTANNMVVSRDGGVTWWVGDQTPQAADAVSYVGANDSRFVLCAGSGKIYPTLASGLGAVQLT